MSEAELEAYEKDGIMLPKARINYPEEYKRQEALYVYHIDSHDEYAFTEFPEVDRCFENTESQYWQDFKDKELIHSFDREFDQYGSDSLLQVPQLNNFKPWNESEIKIDTGKGYFTTRNTVDHFYSYWQVHQLYQIQKFPALWKNRKLLEYIPQEIIDKHKFAWTLNPEVSQTFSGKSKLFDMLSFWVTMHNREWRRTFANIPEIHRVRTLSQEEHDAYIQRMKNNAHYTLDRFDYSIDDVFQFIWELLNLHSDYEKNERYKLARELKKDILNLELLIEAITDLSWNEVSEELRTRKFPFWLINRFRHLDTYTKEYDEANSFLSNYSENYTKLLAENKIDSTDNMLSNLDVAEFLDYCVNSGLFLTISSLSQMIATSEEVQEKFRRINKYSNLKHLSTSLEYFLKEVGYRDKGPEEKHPSTLNPVIKDLLKDEDWYPFFKQNSKLYTSGDTIQDFENHLIALLSNEELLKSEKSIIARNFLLASLVRNCSVHTYPTEDWYYGELYAEMLNGVVNAFLISWQIAKRNGWIE